MVERRSSLKPHAAAWPASPNPPAPFPAREGGRGVRSVSRLQRSPRLVHTDHVDAHHLTFASDGPDATRRLGHALGRLAEPGDVVLLRGDLGAGKTTFTQGFAAGAGCDELVNSPTFILVNEYRGRLPIYHADLYRLDDPEEVARLDLSHASLDGVLVVEWPERGDTLLPEERLLVSIAIDGSVGRRFTFIPHGRRAATLVARLQTCLDDQSSLSSRVERHGTDD